MASLTSTSTFSKKAVIWLLYGVVGLVILIILFQVGRTLFNRVIPDPPLPAIVAFGKIPKLDTSEGYKPIKNTQFLIETISGNIPVLEGQARIFRIRKTEPTFGKLEETIRIVDKEDFILIPNETSEGIAKFVDEDDKSKKLTYNTFSRSFEIESDYLSNRKIILGKVKSDKDSINKTYRLLEKLGVPTFIFPKSKVVIENFKIENGFLEESLSLSDTNLSRVSLNREDIEELSIINSRISSPNIWVLLNKNEYVAAKYVNNNIQIHEFSTYPLKSTAKAFEELTNGNGFFNKENNTNIFIIRNVKLGYIETIMHQDYLQPVYIFESDDGLIAYISAVNSLYVN